VPSELTAIPEGLTPTVIVPTTSPVPVLITDTELPS
jgi:hypothetical protein